MLKMVIQWLVLASVSMSLLWSSIVGAASGYLCLGENGHAGIKVSPESHCVGDHCDSSSDPHHKASDTNQILVLSDGCGQCIDIPLTSTEVIPSAKSGRLASKTQSCTISAARLETPTAAYTAFLTAKLLKDGINNTMPSDAAGILRATILLI